MYKSRPKRAKLKAARAILNMYLELVESDVPRIQLDANYYGQTGKAPDADGNGGNARPARFGQSGSTTNPNITKVSVSDFIADVELTAKRTLFQDELETFKRWAALDNRTVALTEGLLEKLGSAFIERGIDPIGKYLQPIDRRIKV